MNDIQYKIETIKLSEDYQVHLIFDKLSEKEAKKLYAYFNNIFSKEKILNKVN